MKTRQNIRAYAGRLGLHRIWYACQTARGKRKLRSAVRPHDLVMLLNEDCRGWILEGICREIEKHFSGSVSYCFFPEAIPAGRAYFVTQYTFLPAYVKANPILLAARTTVLYTHTSDVPVSDREMIYLFNRMYHIVPMNSGNARHLHTLGVDPRRVTCVLGGADPERFKDHRRGHGAVGICALYYPRKNGELILAVARAMPECKFLLIGRGWNQWPHFQTLINLPNFKYEEVSYDCYPSRYAEMDVFLSPSKLEGGPIPLIEAMMSNAVPVATRTGFAPDIITHGVNGFLFDPEAGAAEVCDLIRKAFTLGIDVRATVEHLSWSNFARQVLTCMV